MITYKFIVRKERNNAVMVRFTANRNSSELAIGVSVPPEKIEEVVEGIASNDYKDQSMKIRYYRNVITDLLEGLAERERKAMSAAEFQKRVRNEAYGRLHPDAGAPKGNLVPVFQEKIDSMRNPSSMMTYKGTLDRIRDFCRDKDNAFYKDPDHLTFDDINLRWIKAFDSWMEGRGLAVNTRWLYMSKFRAVINKALDEEIIIKDPFRNYRSKKEKTRKRSLCVEDLRVLFTYPATRFQQFYIDMFKLIFMLCGINAKDLYGLQSVTRDGRIEYRRAKTGRLYSIKVEPEALEIIEKYKGQKNLLMLADRFESHTFFTIYADTMLKKIGKKIDDGRTDKADSSAKQASDLSRISTYWARHTWATIARRLKIPIDDIALALGHSSGHEITDIYIREDTEAIDEANRRVLDYVLYNKR